MESVKFDRKVTTSSLIRRLISDNLLRLICKSLNMKFIDLFAGLGGFHLALSDLGHECVFACEIDENLRDTYQKNFGLYPQGDIRLIDEKDVPSHDILCAGFPCQPFSKAGEQRGMRDRARGGLFHEILRIIRYHQPSFVILENVPHIRRHNEGRTWSRMERLLRNEGYKVRLKDLSPHHFGIPQIRFRTYIVASKAPMPTFEWPNRHLEETSIQTVLEKNPPDAWPISSRVSECLSVWQEFLDIIPQAEKIPLPLWAMEFGATYPYKRTTPHAISLKHLKRYKGSFGMPILGLNRKIAFQSLPSHGRREDAHFPKWKIEMIERNRIFYAKNKGILRSWIKKIQRFPPSYQKLEWNCNGDPRDISSYIIQMRASGVRVKRRNTAPTLVAMNKSQIPIIPEENRYITLNECKALQSMGSLKHLPPSSKEAYKALGNAVNVKVVKLVAESLLSNDSVVSKVSK
jgi:DNA (cytosine-5)-methyltransferase 1